jgi:hypothetical protein
LLSQLIKARTVRRRQCSHDEFNAAQDWEKFDPDNFPKPSLNPIPLYRCVRVARHDDSGPAGLSLGSDMSNLDVRHADTVSLQAHILELLLPRQPAGSRKPPSLRRQRISMAA